MPSPDRHQQVRSAVAFSLRALDSAAGDAYVLDDVRPDEIIRDHPAIDFTATGTAGQRMGIEHTMIEPYDGYLVDISQADERLGGIRCRLEGALPEGSVFDLSFGPGAVRAMRSSDANNVATWVTEVAPTLTDAVPGRPGHWAVSPPGRFRAQLTLYRWARTHPGPQVRYRIGMGDDAEQRAERRLARALLDRLPKLEASRAELGVEETMLCLESPDWQLSSPWTLGDLLRAWEGPGSMPDHIAVVMHDPGGDLGLAVCLRVSGSWVANPSLCWPPDAPA